ncbi:hypothetical protein G7Y89_g2720 [Cudoniella acicularis]|uniref:Uncharacterized protein n=1 Tax=Cudoniella acicularis TaxID=354080 RepID=A0A8H4RU10_9HELO|nr:hypothetical protein G7Y89_g2720 [Cudoniella acicularis]
MYKKHLDKLLQFPGLWEGLQLGNTRRHLALHCDRELLNYLKHIKKTWKSITQNNPSVKRAVDIQTVRNLQMRAPAASLVDRAFIQSAMANGTLFSTISDNSIRKSIEETLLGLQVMIPTIRSFHENAKYFSIGAKIMRNLLLSGQRKKPLFEAMSSAWLPPQSTLFEISEAEFQSGRELETTRKKELAYVQVFISAQRQFPYLSDEAPLKDAKTPRQRADIYPGHHKQFLEGAKILGYTHRKIIEGITNFRDVELPARVQIPQYHDEGESSIDRRWNRPHSSTYQRVRDELFLTRIWQEKIQCNRLHPSIMYIQRDFLQAFFGSYDLREVVLIEENTPRQHVETNFHSQPNVSEENLDLDDNGHSDINEMERVEPRERNLSLSAFGLPRTLLSPRTTTTGGTLTVTRSVASRSPLDSPPRASPRINELAIQLGQAAMHEVLEENVAVNGDAASLTSITTNKEEDVTDIEDVTWASENNVSHPLSNFQGQRSYLTPISVPTTPNSSNETMLASTFGGGHRSYLKTTLRVSQSSQLRNSGITNSRVAQWRDHVELDSAQSTPRSIESVHRVSGTATSHFQGARSYLESGITGSSSYSVTNEDGSSIANTQGRLGSPLTDDDVEMHRLRTSQGSRSFLGQGTDRTSSSVTSRRLTQQLTEYNGMKYFLRLTSDLETYLQQRGGWIGMIVQNGVAKTIRLDHVVQFIRNGGLEGKSFVLVKPPHAARFRSQIKASKHSNSENGGSGKRIRTG